MSRYRVPPVRTWGSWAFTLPTTRGENGPKFRGPCWRCSSCPKQGVTWVEGRSARRHRLASSFSRERSLDLVTYLLPWTTADSCLRPREPETSVPSLITISKAKAPAPSPHSPTRSIHPSALLISILLLLLLLLLRTVWASLLLPAQVRTKTRVQTLPPQKPITSPLPCLASPFFT